MRRSFDGLAMMVEYYVHRDPMSGHLFVFRNKNGDKAKILYWDRDGLAIWYKRLEKGSFQFPINDDGYVEVTSVELAMLLEGIDLESVRRKKRFKSPVLPR
jgi:transposase